MRSYLSFNIDVSRQRLDPLVNRHATEEFAKIADTGAIYRAVAGSQLHGVLVGGDDRDETGICVEPASHVIGLKTFSQYIMRTQPEGARSGTGDLDLTVYSLKKWVRLALAGNPTILLGFFVPQEQRLTTQLGDELLARKDKIVSAECGARFAGYLNRQRASMLSHDGKGRDVTRPELIEAYGFDSKYASHMVRLGLQGVELLSTGKITLPVPEPWRTWLIDCRNGKHTMDEALSLAADLEQQIVRLTSTTDLRPRGDWDGMSAWLCDAYRAYWAGYAH